jgi:hypothetical protein
MKAEILAEPNVGGSCEIITKAGVGNLWIKAEN